MAAAGTASSTGNGATFVITSGVALTVTQLSGQGASIESVENNTLADVTGQPTLPFSKSLPGDLVTANDLTIDFTLRNVDLSVFEAQTGVVRACILTYPIVETGGTQGQQTTGTGWISDYEISTVENNQRIDGTATWHWDGVTGPVSTDEVVP